MGASRRLTALSRAAAMQPPTGALSPEERGNVQSAYPPTLTSIHERPMTTTARRQPKSRSQLLVESPLRHLDSAAISAAARVETRNREVYLPPISVYRWWARRTEAVNGAVIDAVAAERTRDEPMLVVDPFAGGGVIPLAALMRRHRVYAQDLNPWATFGLAAMLALPDPDLIREGVGALTQRVTTIVQAAYGTTSSTGQPATVSHTFRVATAECLECGHRNRLFPHSMVSLVNRKERRVPDAWLACPNGHVVRGRFDQARKCPECRVRIEPDTGYTVRRVATCACCGSSARLQDLAAGGSWQWEVALVERTFAGTRELDLPTTAEVNTADDPLRAPTRDLGLIPDGQETRVLQRHGFSSWNDLYPSRQRWVLEQLLALTAHASDDTRVTHLLRMAVIGSAEMAGLLSRWDRWYLKSFESMAGHRFNFTTLTVEPNAWGTPTSGRGTTLRRLAQLIRAAEWSKKNLVATTASVHPVRAGDVTPATTDVTVVEGSSETINLASGSVDLVLTDPPYHDDVQYAELSMPLRAWAELARDDLTGDAAVNPATSARDDESAYARLLERIFLEIRRVLQPDGHLIFSFANREPTVWVDLFAALQAAGLRAAGCAIVHSENERDQAKRDVRACTSDLLLDLVPASKRTTVTFSRPEEVPQGSEGEYLKIIAKWFEQVGNLTAGWQDDMTTDCAGAAFLAS